MLIKLERSPPEAELRLVILGPLGGLKKLKLFILLNKKIKNYIEHINISLNI